MSAARLFDTPAAKCQFVRFKDGWDGNESLAVVWEGITLYVSLGIEILLKNIKGHILTHGSC